MKKFIAIIITLFCISNLSAKEVEVKGFYIKMIVTDLIGQTTYKVYCAIVSDGVCFTMQVPDNKNITCGTPLEEPIQINLLIPEEGLSVNGHITNYQCNTVILEDGTWSREYKITLND